MTPYELLDIALSVGNRVDVQWGLFITVHLALFGGIIYVDRPLRLPEKVGAMALYTAFGLINFRIMQIQVDLLHNAYREIADRMTLDCCANNQLLEYVATDVASGRFAFTELFLVGGHLLMAFLVVVSIVFDTSIGSKKHDGNGP